MFLAKRSYIFVPLVLALSVAAATVARAQTGPQGAHDHRLFPCVDDGLNSSEFGCLLLAKLRVPRFPGGQLFWHLNKFPTREAAETAKGQVGLVVEAEGHFWLYSFGPKNAAPKQGEFVTSVGPLKLTSDRLPPAKSYEVVAYLAVMPAGAHTRVHTHPGPEAWYVLAGEQCLETPEGTIKARAGEGAVVRPSIPMRLTNSGTTTRRALFIVVHDAAHPWSVLTEDWKPTGACDR